MSLPRIGQALVAGAILVTLLSSHGSAETTLVPVQAQDVQLENTQWTAIAIDGDAIRLDRPPALSFEQEGTFGGFGGCNRFSGQAELAGDSLVFPDNMAATLMACPPEVEEVEDRFLDAMQRVAGYVLGGENLVLLDSEGAPVLTLTRSQ